ncbi:MAG: tartrate dehydrogenase [Dehalococcoidia bacterium]
MNQTYRIALLPGDGIGLEVVPAAIRVLEAAGATDGVAFTWDSHDWGCQYYLKHGRMMPEDGLHELRGADAIFLGAVGAPEVPDDVSLWGLLIPIRRSFDQYINLRPVRSMVGLDTPLRNDDPFDFVVVRENTEGEYSEIGGRLFRGSEREIAVQEAVFSRIGVQRAVRFAFDLARKRDTRVDSATKSNGIIHTMPFWDEIVEEVAEAFPGVEHGRYHVDALAAQFVLDPYRFGVVVASNLLGDILTDLGAAITGSIGIAPSANINPERTFPSMFEPVHGSAPDIVGRGIANPVGQIWSGAMMLDHLGEPGTGDRIRRAFERVFAETDIRTPDLGGSSTTDQFTEAVLANLPEG